MGGPLPRGWSAEITRSADDEPDSDSERRSLPESVAALRLVFHHRPRSLQGVRTCKHLPVSRAHHSAKVLLNSFHRSRTCCPAVWSRTCCPAVLVKDLVSGHTPCASADFESLMRCCLPLPGFLVAQIRPSHGPPSTGLLTPLVSSRHWSPHRPTFRIRASLPLSSSVSISK